jgi:hypothetical protein
LWRVGVREQREAQALGAFSHDAMRSFTQGK